jgi:hypothetical protein
MTFFQDLQLGEIYQKRFLYLYQYDTCEIAKGCFKDWDIKMTYEGTTIYVEVKYDRRAETSGNLAIEFECSGKPSGVATTKADYWCHFVKGSPFYYMIPIEDLKKAIEEKKYTRTVRGGDGWRANMYLFPMTVFNDFRESLPPEFLQQDIRM